MNENKFKSIKSEYKATDLILKCRGNSNALLQKFIDMQHCVDIIPKEHSEGFELCVTLKPFKNPNRCIKHIEKQYKLPPPRGRGW